MTEFSEHTNSHDASNSDLEEIMEERVESVEGGDSGVPDTEKYGGTIKLSQSVSVKYLTK